MKTRTRPDPPCCSDAIKWLRARRIDLGSLTGQDARALAAIAHCWRLYASSDDDGRRAAIDAIRALCLAMQPKCWVFARELIPYELDWSDTDRLWPHPPDGDIRYLPPRLP
jgi:hypothetical protein